MGGARGALLPFRTSGTPGAACAAAAAAAGGAPDDLQIADRGVVAVAVATAAVAAAIVQ